MPHEYEPMEMRWHRLLPCWSFWKKKCSFCCTCPLIGSTLNLDETGSKYLSDLTPNEHPIRYKAKSLKVLFFQWEKKFSQFIEWKMQRGMSNPSNVQLLIKKSEIYIAPLNLQLSAQIISKQINVHSSKAPHAQGRKKGLQLKEQTKCLARCLAYGFTDWLAKQGTLEKEHANSVVTSRILQSQLSKGIFNEV